MTLTTIIFLVLLLYFVQLFLQETARFGFNLPDILGNRDNPQEASVVAGRLDRAKNNMMEALPIFLTLALLALVKGDDTSEVANAATIFLVARVFYVPAYASGIPVLRSLIWLVSVASLAMMALPLL